MYTDEFTPRKETATQQTPYGQRPMPCPESYLVWAILSTVLCCWPFGIASIVYATRVEPRYLEGNYAEALENSRKAKKWAIVSAIAAGAVYLIYILAIVVFCLNDLL